MSTNEVGASTRPAPSPARDGIRGSGIRGIRDFAERWPFRRKLNILVGVPLAVVAVLLAYLFADQVGQSQDASDAAQLVRDSAQVAKLVGQLEAEHQQAVLLSVRHQSTWDGNTPSQSAYREAQTRVDNQVEKVLSTFGDRLPEEEAQALREVNGLEDLRNTIEKAYLPADNIDPAYSDAAKGLIDGLGLDRNPALAATFTGNLLDSLLRADAAHGSFETGVFSATTGDSNALIELIGAIGSYDEYTHQVERFGRFATTEQAEELGDIEHNTAQATIARQYAELQIDPGSLQAGSPAEIKAAFQTALDSYPDYRTQARTRLKTTTSLIDQIADRADAASRDARSNAAWLLGAALLGFVLWFAFSVAVRRSVVRPVQALTGAAKQVAEVAGRELARVADDDTEDDGPPRLQEMPVTAKDEIGDLADVFNQVQTTSLALLERQVLSRRNVAEMFGNVGRRVSNLTTRQLALIDAVERGETDPELLERLYSIDHIAVRLRRNADSLMLLAGIRETVLDSGPLALTNVVRAALGQIEGFQRVSLQVGTEVMVEPDIIGDLTLMVAELVENAVSFSPAGSPVEVIVKDSHEGALVVISDHGLGMSAERLEEENARLIRRERLDLVPTKVLGLFVVGSLARRWEVAVTLSRTPGGGVTAEVTIPSSLLLTMSPVAVAAGGPTAAAATDSAATDARTAATAGHSGSVPDAAEDARTVSTAAAVHSGAGTGAPAARPAPAWASDTDSDTDSNTTPAPAPAPSTGPTAVRPDSGQEAAAGTAARGTAPSEPGVTGGASGDGDHAPLPRRVPQRDAAPTGPGTGSTASETPSPAPPFIPKARTGDVTGTGAEEDGPRPLRRRVRGATLRTTVGADALQKAVPPRPADAEAVRDALDEFEAAVERAHRDSDTGSHTRPALRDDVETRQTASNPPHEQNHSPEGAEQ
ncbi:MULTISPECIES: ATP-binding protein [unclassified Streptomyces]|uniref:ATP-binding protein n=1 Tax=unclassified Streptomyces TaxID=2593676 RepID=UPI002476CE5B|nr:MULTISPECIES: ATP-binding protein [unclassified Streptomyces]MDH6453646.1 signal transduction histidine kinase [Streptomyces sp. SAI-119]MDH6495798.1 signal transduction histidine kinase [Streptomyces sp. SAI-149]